MLDDDKAPIAEFKNLKVVFETKDGTVTGVEDVSFSIYPGETVCVVGEFWLWKICVITINDASCRIWWRENSGR